MARNSIAIILIGVLFAVSTLSCTAKVDFTCERHRVDRFGDIVELAPDSVLKSQVPVIVSGCFNNEDCKVHCKYLVESITDKALLKKLIGVKLTSADYGHCAHDDAKGEVCACCLVRS